MATATEAVQLNVRLPRMLREAGDTSLSSIGLTPSTAIRLFWEKASRRGKDLEEIAAMLMPTDETETAPTDLSAVDDEVLERGWSIVGDGMRALGQTNWSQAGAQPSYEDLLVEALHERELERQAAWRDDS